MKKKRVYILAPNDRFNYGDLIFPYILQHYLQPDIEDFIFCSTSSVDMCSLGGHKTVSFRALYNLDDANYDNYLIIAGGECLLASWRLYRFVDKNTDRVYKLSRKILPARFSNWVLSKYIDIVVKPKTKYPFTTSRFELPCLKKVLYNSVGASLLESKPLIEEYDKKILDAADYLSVRDENTHNGLKRNSIKSVLVPDSAILMSKVFSIEAIKNKCRQEILNAANHNHIFFQIGLPKLQGHERLYAQMLTNIHNKYKTTIVLCPIGTALGHEDQVALKKISEHMPTDIYSLVEKPNLWEIMYLISTAKLYIGTSLHGAITSMSFGVPLLCHGPQKLRSYIKTWYSSDIDKHFCNYEELEDRANFILRNPIVNDCEKQFHAILQSLNEIKNQILI